MAPPLVAPLDSHGTWSHLCLRYVVTPFQMRWICTAAARCLRNCRIICLCLYANHASSIFQMCLRARKRNNLPRDGRTGNSE